MRIVLVLMMVLVATISCAKDKSVSVDAVKQEISKRFKIGEDNITVSDINLPKLYEVSLKSGEVFYADSNGETLLIGRLIDKDGKDLTKVKEDEFNKVKVAEIMKQLDLTKAVRIGDGKTQVIEFTDVDCPYCFRAEGFFAGRDISRYIFFTPLDELHPEAGRKSAHILCSDNASLEYVKVINNEVTEFKTCNKGEELLREHRAFGKIAGVTGTPHFIINGKSIIGADPKIVNEIEGM